MQESQSSTAALEYFVRFSVDLPKKFLAEIPNDEKIIASIQGRFEEWLVCTDKQVHIIKSGFPTGNVGKTGHFSIIYRNISNVFVDFHASTGCFDIIAIGIPHTKKTYWGEQMQNPQYAPDSIGITKKDIEKFKSACAYINARSVEEKEACAAFTQSEKEPITQIGKNVPAAEEHHLENCTQEINSVRCPKCGSTNLQVYNEVVGKGVSGTKVCLFGICGLCGAGKTKNVQYWICKNCGYKFKA